MKFRLVRAGYRVISAHERTDRVMGELDQIIRGTRDKVALVIDNYGAWMDVVEAVSLAAPQNLLLLLAARTHSHDVLIDRVSALFDGKVSEYAVDNLSKADITWLRETLDFYGMWGERAAWTRAKKEDRLARYCGGEFHAFLLDLFESPDIRERFRQVLAPVIERGEYWDVIVTVLVLSLIGYAPTLDMLADLAGESVFDTGFRRDSVIKQLVDFERGRARLRSSVAAQFVLKQITDPNITVDVLIRMARAADSAAKTAPRYREIFRSLMRFSTIQETLPNDVVGAAVARYYENIKNLDGARREPLFWLQYGIAALSLDQLERAKSYFESAYAFAEQRPHFNTYQIDNHYARLLLLLASRSGTPEERMQGFRTARRIVNEQIRSERLHYPYRVAVLYREFYESAEGDLSEAERDEVRKAAEFVLRRIDELPPERKQQRYIRECQRALNLIVGGTA